MADPAQFLDPIDWAKNRTASHAMRIDHFVVHGLRIKLGREPTDAELVAGQREYEQKQRAIFSRHARDVWFT